MSILRTVAVLAMAGLAPAQEPVVLDRAKVKILLDRHKEVAVLTKDRAVRIERTGRPADVRLDANAILAFRVDEAPKWASRGEDAECRLPYRFTRDAEVGNPPDLALVLIVVGGAIDYDPAQRLYTGSFLLGVTSDTGAPSQPLPDVRIQLVLNGGRLDPDQVALVHSGQPFVRAGAEARSVDGDQVTLTVIPSFAESQAISVPVRRPVLRISASPETIQGFGLQASIVTVSAEPGDAERLKRVRLGASLGKLDPEDVELDPQGGTGATTLFSSGIGTSEVRVLNSSVSGEVGRVAFVFPFAFLLSALAGGVVGGFVARYRASRKRPVLGTLLRGALNGLLAALAIALGINLLSLDLAKIYAGRGFSEGLVFLAAAIAAAFGLLRPGQTKAPKR